MLLIGSSAIKFWFSDFPRDPKDTDYVIDSLLKLAYRPKDSTIEYHINPVLFDKFDCTDKITILSPDKLLTLKISHLFWDIFWNKHMFDVQFLLKKGACIDMKLFHELYSYWEKYHGANKRSDLKMTADGFFNNAMKKYDHDILHELLVPSPTYFKVLKDGSEVEPDEQKFQALSHQEKLDLVREEVYVMAYERLGGRDYREAYAWMLKKFIIAHAPMWEALWIINNYVELHKPHINYKTLLDDKIEQTARGKKVISY